MDLRITAAVVALLGSTSAFSAVTLTVPEEIKMIAVNDQEVRSGLLRSDQTYKLDAGTNAISVRYTEFFQHNDNSHDILKSGVITVKTPELKDGEAYKLGLINAPKNFDEAKNIKISQLLVYMMQKSASGSAGRSKRCRKPLLGQSILGKSVDLTTNKVVTPTNQPAAVYTQTAKHIECGYCKRSGKCISWSA